MSYVLAVTALVLEDGGDETDAIAALLHDAVEDSGNGARLTDIRNRFGTKVATIVDADGIEHVEARLSDELGDRA